MKEELKENILEVENLAMVFGGLTALTDTKFQLKKGTIKAIIGPTLDLMALEKLRYITS